MKIKQKVTQLAVKVENVFSRWTLSDDNRGMGVIEVILIIVVLVGLVMIFRTQITNVLNNIFSKLTAKVNTF